jgi:hypothetical protein
VLFGSGLSSLTGHCRKWLRVSEALPPHGEQRWLDRVRRFAVHAIEQHRRDAVEYGQRRYPLWTGDPGLAVYLSNCIAGTDFFPTMDNFFGSQGGSGDVSANRRIVAPFRQHREF